MSYLTNSNMYRYGSMIVAEMKGHADTKREFDSSSFRALAKVLWLIHRLFVWKVCNNIHNLPTTLKPSSPTTATYPPLVHRSLWRTAELPKGFFSGRGRENWHDCPCDVNSSQCWSKCSYSNDCACAFCRCVYMCVCTLLNHKHTYYSYTPYACVSVWVWLRECVGGGRTGEGGRERSLNYRWNTTIFVKYYYVWDTNESLSATHRDLTWLIHMCGPHRIWIGV